MPIDPEDLDAILANAFPASALDELQDGLMSASVPGARRALRDVSEIAPTLTLDDFLPRLENRVQARAADLITGINAATRAEVEALVQQGLDEGLGADELARRIEERFTAWATPDPTRQSRAEMIARTEMATAYNHATLDGYQTARVNNVRVYDGDYDEACRAANGQVWSVEESRSRVIEHPNCTRAFAPELPPLEGESWV